MTWTYDDPVPDRFAIGRLSSMTDPAGTSAYDYDRRGLLTEERRTYVGCFVTRESGTNCAESFESRTFTTGYRYDRDGNQSTIQYPSHRVNVNYTFDYAGRPLSASGAVDAAAYLPFGPVRQIAFANGTTQTLSYDARYRVTENKLSTATATLARYAYTYDAAGNITAINDAMDPRYNRAFGYDDLHRLVTANTGTALWREGSYTWDAMGNPRTIKLGEVAAGGNDGLLRSGRPIRTDAEWLPGGRTLDFSYQDTTPRIDRVTRNASSSPGEAPDPGLPVTYDAAGNEVGYLVTRTYSPRNLLAEVVRRGDEEGDPFEHKLRYAYDGRGIRVVRGETPSDGIAATARRYFIYTPELKLLSVTKDDAPNIWTATAVEKDMQHEIIWFGGRPVAQIPLTGGRRYTFTDHLGTPIIQTNDEATVVWRAEYEPFGHIWDMRRDVEGEEIGRRTDQPLRFPGQEVAMSWEGQEENYNIHRWYRSGWGRYTQSDPISLAGGLNLYAYAWWDPINHTDPTGLVSWTQNAPVYHATDWDIVMKKCGSWKARGCAIPNLKGDCDCICEDGKYRPKIKLSLSPEVWARQDHPTIPLLTILYEEEKHIKHFKSMFKWAIKRAEHLEAQRFSSKKECDEACQAFYKQTLSDFSPEWVHEHNPHP